MYTEARTLHGRESDIQKNRHRGNTTQKIVFTLLVIAASFSPANGEAPSGGVEIEAGGIGISRNEAILKAKRAAVENGIGTILHSETEVKNFLLKKDIILTRTAGSVKSIKILSEKRENNIYEVRIRAVVSMDSIKDNLAALRTLLDSMEKPRVMVVVQETRQGKTSPEFRTAETEIVDFLTKKGFTIVDPGQVSALTEQNYDLIERAVNGEVSAAVRLGAGNGADVILVGKATGSTGKGDSFLGNLKPGRGDLNVKVITCATGAIITAKNAHATKPNISEKAAMTLAIKAAAGKLMDEDIFENIISAWEQVSNNGRPLLVTVQGLRNFRTVKSVKQRLAEMNPDVVRVVQRGFKKSELFLEILYKGTVEGFCEAADEQIVGNGAEITVTEFTSNSVKLKIVYPNQ